MIESPSQIINNIIKQSLLSLSKSIFLKNVHVNLLLSSIQENNTYYFLISY